MKKLLLILAALIVAGGAVALLMSNRAKQEAQLEAARKPIPTTVSVTTAVRQTVAESASYVGKTEYWREVQMNATTQGTIRSLTARLNGPVRAGQPVVTVDTELTEIALTQAEAGLRKAQTDLARYEALHRENNLPAAELENARLGVKTAETQLLTLKKQLRDAVVKAPISGIVTDKPVERGMFIAPGAPLLTITDVSAVKVVVGVPEAELTHFRPGRPVGVRFDAYPDKIVTGTVHQIRLKGGETGKFPVEIRVSNASARLRVGMTATVSLPNVATVTGVAIPRAALVTTSQTPAVYVLQGNRIALRPVEPGAPSGTTLLVRSGLRPGEKVVTSGTEGLKDGQAVSSE